MSGNIIDMALCPDHRVFEMVDDILVLDESYRRKPTYLIKLHCREKPFEYTP